MKCFIELSNFESSITLCRDFLVECCTLCFTLDCVIPLKANFVTLTTIEYLYNKQEKPPMLFSEFLSENLRSRQIEIKMTMWEKDYFHNHIYGIQRVMHQQVILEILQNGII